MRCLYRAYRERELDRLGGRGQFGLQMVEMAMQRKYKCKVVGEAFSYDEELQAALCLGVSNELLKLEPYLKLLSVRDPKSNVFQSLKSANEFCSALIAHTFLTAIATQVLVLLPLY